MIRPFAILTLGAAIFATSLRAQSPRYVVDDDAYPDNVATASEKLRRAHKLVPLETLRREIHTKGMALKLPPPARLKLSPPDLCDRLRESTLAVGTYYKCPDCGGWHFDSSSGFVVTEGGVICTCCHVIQAPDFDAKGTNTTSGFECYLVAADAEGRVFPVESVLAADTDADTCFLKIDAHGLKPLPLRPGARVGEPVWCLSNPGGYFFMFTQGMISRLNMRHDGALDDHGKTNGPLGRPILFLNITAEFAPGSSGGPVTDDAGNVVGQVASIADAGEPAAETDTNGPAAPSVPIRFCTAAEEILRMTSRLPEDKYGPTPTKLHKKSREPQPSAEIENAPPSVVLAASRQTGYGALCTRSNPRTFCPPFCWHSSAVLHSPAAPTPTLKAPGKVIAPDGRTSSRPPT